MARSRFNNTMHHAYAEVVTWKGKTKDTGKCAICNKGKDHVLHGGKPERVLIANRTFLVRATETHIFTPERRVRKGRPVSGGSARCAICGGEDGGAVHDTQGVV